MSGTWGKTKREGEIWGRPIKVCVADNFEDILQTTSVRMQVQFLVVPDRWGHDARNAKPVCHWRWRGAGCSTSVAVRSNVGVWCITPPVSCSVLKKVKRRPSALSCTENEKCSPSPYRAKGRRQWRSFSRNTLRACQAASLSPCTVVTLHFH